MSKSEVWIDENIQELTAAYCSAFTIPFTLMNVHFLYRYWTVQRPLLVHLFSRPSFITVLVTIPLVECVRWYASFVANTGLTQKRSQIQIK